jgi:hypothetical protein
MRSVLFNNKNLPTPPCKQHFPPKLNAGASCAVNATTAEEAKAKGILPPDWNTRSCNDCLHPGLPHKQPTISQNIPVNTPLNQYTNEQLQKLKGQHINKID